MTGAEFAAQAEYAMGYLSEHSRMLIAREFDAAVAAMTAERDRLALDFSNCADVGRRLELHLNAARNERDAANAARESQWKELQAAMAALERAHAALSHAVAYAPCDCGPPGDVHDDECAHHGADAVLADPEGRAAAEYVAALEAEHAEIKRLGSNLHGFVTLAAAHAAVEALRVSGAE